MLRAEHRLLDVPVYPNFVTPEEEEALMVLVKAKLGKEKYERLHLGMGGGGGGGERRKVVPCSWAGGCTHAGHAAINT